MGQMSSTVRYIIMSFGLSFLIFGMLELAGYALWDSIFAQYITESSESQQIASTAIVNFGTLIGMLSAVLWLYLGDVVLNKADLSILMLLLAFLNTFLWYFIAVGFVGGTGEFGIINRITAFSRLLVIFSMTYLKYPTLIWLLVIISYHLLLIPICNFLAVYTEEE